MGFYKSKREAELEQEIEKLKAQLGKQVQAKIPLTVWIIAFLSDPFRLILVVMLATGIGFTITEIFK